MRATYRIAAALTGMALLAGFTAGCTGQAASPADAAAKAFHQRAEEIVKDWEASSVPGTIRQGLTLFSDTTWRPYFDASQLSLDGHVRDAINGEWFVLRIPHLNAPPPGTVRFAGGGTLTVPLETAYQAFDEFAKAPACPPAAGCRALTITGAQLATRHMMTGRGEADVPVWRFAVAGLDQPLDQVAVAPSARGPAVAIDWPRYAGIDMSTHGYVGATSLQSVNGTSVTFRAYSGDLTHLTPLVYEDARTIVLGAAAVEPPGVPDDVLKVYRLPVTLAAPAGDRMILDVATGYPSILDQRLF